MRNFLSFCLALLVSCLFAVTPCLSKNGRDRDDSRVIDAAAAISDGDMEKAKGILGKILADDPENDAALYYLGVANIYTWKFTEAQDCLRKAAELDPGNYWYRDRLALAYSLADDDDMTIATYEALLKDFPKKNDIYYSLVNLYLKNNKFDKALSSLDQIETVFGKSEMVTKAKYDILLRQNKPEEALKTLKDFNEEFSSAAILTKMGDHAMAEYKDSVALANYDEALTLESGFAPAVLGKAEVFRSRRDYANFFKELNSFMLNEETIPIAKAQYMEMLLARSEPRFAQNFRPQLDTVIENLVTVSPKDSSALLLAAQYYYSSNRTDKAGAYFARNREVNPGNVRARAMYIQFLGIAGNNDKVLEECEAAIKDFPKELVFVEQENAALYQAKDYQGILDNCVLTIGKFAGDTSVTIPTLAMMGDIYHEMGDEKSAFQAYERVLKLNPDHSPTLNNYAYFLALKGKKLKKAYEMSKKAVDKNPDNPTYLDTIGWILHLMNRDEEAKAHFKHAMIYGGKESATTLEHYSEVLKALGEKDLSNLYESQAKKLREQGKE